jgi:hypothetical protein
MGQGGDQELNLEVEHLEAGSSECGYRYWFECLLVWVT